MHRLAIQLVSCAGLLLITQSSALHKPTASASRESRPPASAAPPAPVASPCFVFWDKPGGAPPTSEHLFPTCGDRGPLLADTTDRWRGFAFTRGGAWLALTTAEETASVFALNPPFTVSQRPDSSSALVATCGTILAFNRDRALDLLHGKPGPDGYKQYACSEDRSIVVGTRRAFLSRDDMEPFFYGVPPHPFPPLPKADGAIWVNSFAVSPHGRYVAFLVQRSSGNLSCRWTEPGNPICVPFDAADGDWPYGGVGMASGYVYFEDVTDAGQVVYVGFDPTIKTRVDPDGSPDERLALWLWAPPAPPALLIHLGNALPGVAIASSQTIANLRAWSAHWHATTQPLPEN